MGLVSPPLERCYGLGSPAPERCYGLGESRPSSVAMGLVSPPLEHCFVQHTSLSSSHSTSPAPPGAAPVAYVIASGSRPT